VPRWFISSREHKIFTDRKRKVLRKRITKGEVAFTIVFGVIVVLMGAWFFDRKDDFDPGERDIAVALLEEGSVVDNLYRTPMLRWVDPLQRTATGGATQPDLTPFPASVLDNAWEPSSRLQHFTKDNLYEKINGAADQFFQFGFVQMHYVSLKKTGGESEVSIELYDMGNLENALGIFGAQRDASVAVTSAGAAHYYPTAAGAIGIAGQYFFKVSGNSEAAEIQDKGKALATVFSDMASRGSAPLPTAFRVLAQDLNVPFDAILFEKSDVFQFDFATDFWFGKAGADPAFRYFVHEAKSTEDAAALYSKLLENQLFDNDEVSRTDDEVLLKHKVLNAYLSIGKKGNIVYGVDGAPETAALDQALASLRAALDGQDDADRQPRPEQPQQPEQQPEASEEPEEYEDEAYPAS